MEVHKLNFKHHKSAPLFFENISFKLDAGKLHALHGKNGIGKTVLFHILSGKISSEAILEGEISNHKNVVLVNQRFDQMIADKFSFAENLKFARMQFFPSPFQSLKEPQYFPELLEKFHIDLNIPAFKLSGGQRQILSLMMVLQRKVEILLLDEPTAALDTLNAEMVFEFLQSLTKQNITLLVVCHDHDLIHRYATGSHLYLEKLTSDTRFVTIR